MLVKEVSNVDETPKISGLSSIVAIGVGLPLLAHRRLLLHGAALVPLWQRDGHEGLPRPPQPLVHPLPQLPRRVVLVDRVQLGHLVAHLVPTKDHQRVPVYAILVSEFLAFRVRNFQMDQLDLTTEIYKG